MGGSYLEQRQGDVSFTPTRGGGAAGMAIGLQPPKKLCFFSGVFEIFITIFLPVFLRGISGQS